MYTISIEAGFCATHRVRLADGTLEPQHGHDWRVRVWFSRSELDETEMVIDFAAARAALHSIVEPLHHTDLDVCAGLADKNPTAEVVARYVFDRLAQEGLAGLKRVEITEAPGCVATYER